jgi:predicted esterase
MTTRIRMLVGTQLIALLLSGAPASHAEVDPEEFERRAFTDSVGNTLPYRLYVPPAYDPARSWPIVVFLHGGGARGSDNEQQLGLIGATIWAEPEHQARNPCFILAPQSPVGWVGFDLELPTGSMLTVLEILDALEQEFNIDTSREYITGYSMGGRGTWGAITVAPNRFAAAAPMAGRTVPSRARLLVHMPIWVWHGAEDATIPVDYSHLMVQALRDLGANPRFTEYRDQGHAIMPEAYPTPLLHDWLFAQRLTPPSAEVAISRVGRMRVADQDGSDPVFRETFDEFNTVQSFAADAAMAGALVPAIPAEGNSFDEPGWQYNLEWAGDLVQIGNYRTPSPIDFELRRGGDGLDGGAFTMENDIDAFVIDSVDTITVSAAIRTDAEGSDPRRRVVLSVGDSDFGNAYKIQLSMRNVIAPLLIEVTGPTGTVDADFGDPDSIEVGETHERSSSASRSFPTIAPWLGSTTSRSGRRLRGAGLGRPENRSEDTGPDHGGPCGGIDPPGLDRTGRRQRRPRLAGRTVRNRLRM